jgi:hypothetical protein
MGSIVCSSFLMWKYKALNKEKEELCAREGIEDSMEVIWEMTALSSGECLVSRLQYVGL